MTGQSSLLGKGAEDGPIFFSFICVVANALDFI